MKSKKDGRITSNDVPACLCFMVYNGAIGKLIRERTQFHKILLKELWVFGEKYTKWHFILLGQEFDKFVVNKLKNRKQDTGNFYNSDDGSVSISVLKWSSVIQGNKFKLEFLYSRAELLPNKHKAKVKKGVFKMGKQGMMVPSCKVASRASVLTLALLPLVGVLPSPFEQLRAGAGCASFRDASLSGLRPSRIIETASVFSDAPSQYPLQTCRNPSKANQECFDFLTRHSRRPPETHTLKSLYAQSGGRFRRNVYHGAFYSENLLVVLQLPNFTLNLFFFC